MIVRNKSHKPISVPLPGGKSLHLSPLKTGQISAAAADHPPVKRLVEAGEIEISAGDTRQQSSGPSGSSKARGTASHRQSSGSHRSGDR